MYVDRKLSATLKRALEHFPSVLVTGPRQSGKTTFLIKEFRDNFDYVTFDDPLTREFARTDPNGFLDQSKGRPLILDEIQYVPELLPYLKMRIDKERRRMGQWLLTGSQQFQLMKNVTESLAGRIAVLELYPFNILERRPDKDSLATGIWVGGYPEPVLYPEKRDLWISSYIQTYIERDVRLLHDVQDLRTFETFIGLCAARHSQVFNMAVLARECGISQPTVKAWANVLSASYILFFLPPYFNNYGKRLIKSPKLYFIDPAIVCTLTRQPNGDAALAGAMGGALFEGFVVGEAIKVFAAKGKKPDIFFWRSHDGLEVDLILQLEGKLYPIEIKLTSTPTLKHLEPLNKFKRVARQNSADTGLLVCRIDQETLLPRNNIAIPWQQFPTWLDSQLNPHIA